ncbi:myotubularin-related protein 4 isoform X5 [Bactrocera dorsalis]|uniref:phosphatidylinositol-3,5-bisphosphate 3-phosphatase n=1 Tax=Bactrocera dorsalis TaxID=27457 RepID=A0ABM3K880_BACDO|nr:myotubularin-related protein 4 isoform X5 [Bactrocera dorsalis]
MEGTDGSPPPSLCIVRATEFFPRLNMEKEDADLEVPYQELAGEFVLYLGRTDDGILSLSTYRIFILKNSTNSETSVPLGLIESLQIRDLFHLIINCKDASTVKCSFETAEQCAEWLRRIQLCVGVPETLESLFAFPFHSYMSDAINTQNEAYNSPEYLERLQRAKRADDDFMREVVRLGFDLNGTWRISKTNEEFKLCPSYPQRLLVPACISDDMLYEVAKFRGSRRLPAVVWRHKKSGAVIARCSQPEVGWFGWRNNTDEQLLKALSEACAFDRGEQMRRQSQSINTTGRRMTSSESTPSSTDGSHEEVTMDEVQKVLIVDARSYASAVTNRARGGGCECIEYYPSAEIEFMNLGNIHVIRRSFQSLRQLCASPADSQNWLGSLEKTFWLQHLSGLLAATITVCHAIEKKGRPVLVHCSDGWDRTPQIVATAQLCLDPYYRTVEGFRVLVEREWLSFGHKFSDRCGHGPGSDELNERCPVFLQWLDLVHQIHKQFPCSFEFNMAYLIKLAQHSHSCLFGTFLCNTYKERCEKSVFERTYSVWPFLSGPMYKSPLYLPNKDTVIWPAHNVRDLHLWTEVYLGSLGNQNSVEFVNNSNENLQGTTTPMTKTRSYGDLVSANIMQSGISRRSSDPNMTVEPNLTMATNSENNSIADTQSEREDLPDNVVEMMQRIENLTIQPNNHDEDNFVDASNSTEDPQTSNALLRELNEPIANTEATADYKSSQLSALNKNELPRHNEKIDNSNDIKPKANGIEHQKGNTNVAHSSRDISDSGGGDASNELKANTDEDLMISVELNDVSPNIDEALGRHNNWHGAVSTSTDTLVPIERRPSTNGEELPSTPPKVDVDVTDGFHTPEKLSTSADKEELGLSSPYVLLKQERQNSSTGKGNNDNRPPANGVNNSIMPNVHGTNGTSNRANILSNSSSNASVSSTSSSLNNFNTNMNNTNSDSNNSIATTMTTATDQSANDVAEIDVEACIADAGTQANSTDAMNESIMILPEHRKLQISVSGKCEAISNNGSSLPTSPTGSDEKPSTSRASGQNSRSENVWNGGGAEGGRQNSGGAGGSGATGSAGSGASGSSDSGTSSGASSGASGGAGGGGSSGASGGAGGATGGGAGGSAGGGAGRGDDNGGNDGAGRGGNNGRDNGGRANGDSDSSEEDGQRRRRPSNSNRQYDGFHIRQPDGSIRYFFTGNRRPGIRSLPLSPPPRQERPHLLYSCPDGLAHALSEQNMRLHQIVQEHMLREDMLLQEIHDMEIELRRKRCPNCNAAQKSDKNEEQCSAADNLENASICSWEAVEDRSAPSSSASSSIQQPNTTSALWVPDHAVKRCTSCQVEFWIGRRKHHCRSCGQIFCADCSEFWAPLPDAKLFKPVRLCGPCYLAVTTRIEQQSNAIIATNMPNYTATTTSTTATAAWTTGGASTSSPKLAMSAVSNATAVTTTTTTTPASSTITATVFQQQQQQQRLHQQPKQRHNVAAATTTTNGALTNLHQPIAVHGIAVVTANTPASSTRMMAPIPITAAAADALQQQQQQRQNAAAAAATASATVAVAAAESSSMSHILMTANKNIAASVAN